MSKERLRADADRWFRQAEDNLAAAGALVEAEKYAQAAFLSQQTAELAMKAVWISLDLDPWGHSIARLIKELPSGSQEVFDFYLEAALALDKLYIPLRYPDALAGLTPAEAYTHKEALAAREHASNILERVREWLDGATK